MSEPDVWIMLVEDRHADVEAFPFTSEALAIAAARQRAGDVSLPEGVGPGDVEYVPGEKELTQEMREDGWVFELVYSIEGDRVRVIRRTVDGARP